MTASDKFSKHPEDLIGPMYDLVPITTFADSDLVDGATSYVARALLASCDGVATVKLIPGTSRTGVPIQKGWNPMGVTRVLAWTPSITGGTLWGGK